MTDPTEPWSNHSMTYLDHLTTHRALSEDSLSPKLWDADPDVCCAAYQLGACAHTEGFDPSEDFEEEDALVYKDGKGVPEGHRFLTNQGWVELLEEEGDELPF